MCDITTSDNTNLENPTGISQKDFKDLFIYSKLSSWAIWDKDDISKLEIFNDSNKPWKQLRPQFVFVGLNCANTEALTRQRFSMFHSARGRDHMLRDAVMDTVFWGGYITDILHDMVGKDGRKIESEFTELLHTNPKCAKKRIESFQNEIEDIERILGRKPLLIALGNCVVNVFKKAREKGVLRESLNGYDIDHQITHYSYRRLSHDQYRQEIKELGRRVCHMRQDAVPDNTMPNEADTIAARHTSRCVTNAESLSSRRSGTETDTVLRNAVAAMSSFLNTSPDYRNNQVCLRKSNNGRLMLRFTSRNPSIRFNYEVKDKHAFAVQYGTVLSDWGEKHGFQVNLGEGRVPGNGVQFIPNINMDVANLDCDVLKKMGDSIVAKLRETIGE